MTDRQPTRRGKGVPAGVRPDAPATCMMASAARDSISSSAYRGECGNICLRTGLRLHFCDGIDLIDGTSEGEMQPALAFYFFLRGTPEAHVGGRPLMPEGAGGDAPQALVLNRCRPELLERHSRKGNHVTKVAVSLTRDWLADSGLERRDGAFDIDQVTRHHLARRDWRPSRRITALAGQVLQQSPYTQPCRKLFLESRVLDLVAETFTELAAGTPSSDAGKVRAVDRQRMRRIEDALQVIGKAGQAELSLERLAQDGGVSVSTLQRLFRTIHGMSAFEFIRRGNLERAQLALHQEGLSVKEAAYLAGYSDAGNFSKAYQRQFGRPPGRPG